MPDLLTNISVAAGAFVAGAYGMWRKVLSDRRDDKSNNITDAAWQQVVATLREEVERMAVRLAAVEEQNRKCEERNEELHQEIIELKARLHVS